MAILEVGWAKESFNENKPFGNGTVVGGDNIAFSKRRYEAIKAVKSGTATPEQAALVSEADTVYQDALSQRS